MHLCAPSWNTVQQSFLRAEMMFAKLLAFLNFGRSFSDNKSAWLSVKTPKLNAWVLVVE